MQGVDIATGEARQLAFISIEARMVLKTLTRQPMTLAALERHWSPTWSKTELLQILSQLRYQKLIAVQRDAALEQGRFVDRYSGTSS